MLLIAGAPRRKLERKHRGKWGRRLEGRGRRLDVSKRHFHSGGFLEFLGRGGDGEERGFVVEQHGWGAFCLHLLLNILKALRPNSLQLLRRRVFALI